MPAPMHLALPPLVALLCAGCALTSRSPAPESPDSTTAAVSVTAFTPRDDRGAIQRHAQVQTLVEQTRALVPGFVAADAPLAQARADLDIGHWDRASAATEEAAALAEAAISDHYARQAHAELARAYTYTGLDDAQLVQLRAAEEILVTGNSRLAYGRLRMLNDQLEKRLRTYVVHAGDSLWVIAGRPDVYSNPRLWPLLWKANLAVIPNPERLRQGQVLRLRPHPTVEEVAAAIEHARGGRRTGLVPDIGPLRRVESR